MPIRFPTEAANDPDGQLNGMPESTGEDDTHRGRADDRPPLRERGTRESSRDDAQRDKDPAKDGR